MVLLTGPMNTKCITAKAEELSAHGIDSRLRQAFQLANVGAELVDDFLQVLQDSLPAKNQLIIPQVHNTVHTSCQSPRGSQRRFGA
jgi:hypothetical protein